MVCDITGEWPTEYSIYIDQIGHLQHNKKAKKGFLLGAPGGSAKCYSKC